MKKHYVLKLFDRNSALMFTQDLGYTTFVEASAHGEKLQDFYSFGSYYELEVEA